MTAAWFSTRCCVCVIKIHIKSFYDRLLINSHLLSLLQFSKQCNVHGGKVKWHFVVSSVRLSRVPKGCDNLAKKGALPRRPRTPGPQQGCCWASCHEAAGAAQDAGRFTGQLPANRSAHCHYLCLLFPWQKILICLCAMVQFNYLPSEKTRLSSVSLSYSLVL